MATVTGTIKDVAGNIYANALVIASFKGQSTTPGAGPYISGGVPSGQFETIVPGSTDSFGVFSMLITGNDTITPTPSTWHWTVVNATGKISFAVDIAITGSSIDISAALQAASAPLNPATGFGNITATGLTVTPGASALLGGGTFTGTFGGNPTLSGNVLIQGTLGVTGASTLGVVTTGQINSTFVVGATATPTLAAALAACPASIAGCHIIVPSNQTITSQLLFNQNQSPLQIDCVNPSAVNGNSGGTQITYSPAAFSTTGIDAALFVNTLTRVVINNCNFNQGNTVKGPACTLTTIVGNGSVATANFANCTFFKGQMVVIAGNSNSGFNGPQMITGVTGTTSFTFVNPTNATGNGGTAQAGVAGIYLKGSQGSTVNNVQVFGFTGAGLVITDDPNPSSGEYNVFNNFHSRQNTIGVGLCQLWVGGGGGSVSGNKFAQGAVAGNTVVNFYTSGIASENSLDTVDTSDTTNTLAVINIFGDGVTNCRGPNVMAGTIESTGPAGQIGYKTFCQMGVFDTEGGLNGTTPTIVKAASSGSYILTKHGGFGVSGFDASACPASNWMEINLPNYKVDCNGNIGIGGATPTSGTALSVNSGGTGGLALGSGATYPMVITSSGVRGSGGAAFMGTLGNGWLSFDFKETTAPTAGAGDDVCYGDSTAHAVKCSFNNGSFFNMTQTIGSGTSTTNGTGINTLTCQAQPTITVTGAAVTDVAHCSLNAALPATWQTGIVFSVPVVTANTVTYSLCNPTATATITPAATVVRCTVTR